MASAAPPYITLRSLGGFEFMIPRQAADGSGFLKDAFGRNGGLRKERIASWSLDRLADEGFEESQTGVVTLEYP